MRKNNVISTYKGLPKEIYVLFIGRIINCIGSFVHPLMSLILTEKIGLSAGEAGIFVTSVAIFQVPALILGGKLVDTVGRKKVIIIFQSLGAIVLFSCGLLPVSTTVAKLMIVSSVLYSISSPAYDALNADLTTPENRKQSYSLIYMGINIGFSIGPLMAGFLFKKYLPVIFMGDAITTIIAMLMIAIFIKEEKLAENKKHITHEKEAAVKGSTLSVLIKRPILIVFSMIMFLYQFGYSQINFTLPLQMTEIFSGNGAKYFGYLGSTNGLVVILVTPILVTLTKKWSGLKNMSLGGAFYALAFGLFAIVLKMPLFFVGMIIMTIGEVLISIDSGAFIANNTPSSHRGRISSLLPLISGAGYALGPMVMGQVINNYSIKIAWTITTISVLIGTIGMFLLYLNQKNKS